MTKTSILLALALFVPACTATDPTSDTPEADLGQVSAELGTPADLSVELVAPTTGVGGARGVFRLVVRNQGGTAAAASKVLITMPSPMSFYSSSPWYCNYGPTLGTIACDFGTMQPNTAVGTNITVALPVTSTTTITGVASTTSAESDTNNNTATATAVLAPPPAPVAVTIAAPRTVTTRACAGTVPSFAGCTPGSFINNTWTFLADGSLLRNNVRLGVWIQPNGPSSLRMEFRNGQGQVMGHYDATGVSATCFEGFTYAGAQSTNASGAIQVCM